MPLDDAWDDPMLRTLEQELAAPFAVQQVSWRVGSTNKKKFDQGNAKDRKGQALAYLDSRDVMGRLDEVCGVAGWQSEYIDAGNGKTCCRVGVKLDGEWIWKSSGAGDTAMEGDKGAFSDAFKRAAVMWGVGRYLYDVSAPWVTLNEYWGIPNEEYAKLEAHLRNYTPRAVGLQTPGENNLAGVLIHTLHQFCQSAQDVDSFIDNNKGMLGKLSAGQKSLVWSEMNKIKERKTEAA